VSSEHRGTERGLYDKLQREEFNEAREFLESRLEDVTLTYEEICTACKASMLFEELKNITSQDLTRYRQRKSREESRASVMRLIEADSESLLDAAAANPTGRIAQFLRRQLTERAVARFDEEIDGLDPVAISKEAARHATVAQRDRKLDLDAEKLRLDERRLELQRQQAELAKDKFGVALSTWKFLLAWFSKNESRIADAMTQRSDELLTELGVFIETNA
jgi:hypothetical protein